MKIIKQLSFLGCLVCFGLFWSTPSFGIQDAPSAEKKKARLSLSYKNYNNYGVRLIASVKVREERSYVGVKGVKVFFYHQEITKEREIGYAISGSNGEAVLVLPDTFYKALDTSDYFTYYAVIRNDPIILDNDDQMDITRSHIELDLEEIDSVKTITFTVSAPGDSVHLAPMEEVEVSIYVERLFGDLPIAEYEYTNSDGQVIAQLSNDIPGDEDGNLRIRVRVDDHDEFGTLIATKKIDWGVPLKISNGLDSGELWSTADNAPLYLVIIITSLVVGIWGIILYLISRIFRIRNLGIN